MLKSNNFISWCFDSVDTDGLHQAKKLMIVLYASPSKQSAGFEQLWFVHFDPFYFRDCYVCGLPFWSSPEKSSFFDKCKQPKILNGICIHSIWVGSWVLTAHENKKMQNAYTLAFMVTFLLSEVVFLMPQWFLLVDFSSDAPFSG